MHKIEINGHKLEIYDSIDELPITRFHAFNRYLLIDSNVGSDLQDFDNHILSLLKFLEKGDTESAKKEVLNLRQNLAFVYDQQSPKLNSFVPLIRTIDGRPVDDLSESGISEVLKLLGESGVTYSTIERWVEDAKKKLKASLMYFFRIRQRAHEQKSTSH